MALTNKVTKRVELPHEEGQWIQVRMPGLLILDRAREARSRQAIKMMSGIDLAQLQTFKREATEDTGPDYDWQTLLTACITAWSYEDKVTPDNVAELDEQTVNAVMAALVPKPTEGDRKNA